jgi:hypothetical protein
MEMGLDDDALETVDLADAKFREPLGEEAWEVLLSAFHGMQEKELCEKARRMWNVARFARDSSKTIKPDTTMKDLIDLSRNSYPHDFDQEDVWSRMHCKYLHAIASWFHQRYVTKDFLYHEHGRVIKDAIPLADRKMFEQIQKDAPTDDTVHKLNELRESLDLHQCETYGFKDGVMPLGQFLEFCGADDETILTKYVSESLTVRHGAEFHKLVGSTINAIQAQLQVKAEQHGIIKWSEVQHVEDALDCANKELQLGGRVGAVRTVEKFFLKPRPLMSTAAMVSWDGASVEVLAQQWLAHSSLDHSTANLASLDKFCATEAELATHVISNRPFTVALEEFREVYDFMVELLQQDECVVASERLGDITPLILILDTTNCKFAFVDIAEVVDALQTILRETLFPEEAELQPHKFEVNVFCERSQDPKVPWCTSLCFDCLLRLSLFFFSFRTWFLILCFVVSYLLLTASGECVIASVSFGVAQLDLGITCLSSHRSLVSQQGDGGRKEDEENVERGY